MNPGDMNRGSSRAEYDRRALEQSVNETWDRLCELLATCGGDTDTAELSAQEYARAYAALMVHANNLAARAVDGATVELSPAPRKGPHRP